MKCGDCKFWVLISGSPSNDDFDPGVGECHRRAPAPAPTSDGPTRCMAWPVTLDEAFCGEHAPKVGRVGFV
jgi:hypothetical protein